MKGDLSTSYGSLATNEDTLLKSHNNTLNTTSNSLFSKASSKFKSKKKIGQNSFHGEEDNILAEVKSISMHLWLPKLDDAE